MPVHIAALIAYCSFECPVVDTRMPIDIEIRTRIVTIKSSFISRMCFHTQIYMNFAREMKNNVRKPYQITTIETHCFKLHISKGNGPNHTLQLLIPHTIIPYKAPYEMIKTSLSGFQIAKKSATWSYRLILPPGLITRPYHLILQSGFSLFLSSGLTIWPYLLDLTTTWSFHLFLPPILITWSYHLFFPPGTTWSYHLVLPLGPITWSYIR